MRAIAYEKYGGPEILQLTEVDQPKPKDFEILVKVKAVSLNPLDWHFMRGTPKLMRLQSGLRKPKLKVLGADFSGIVEAVGTKVSQFKIGDEVYGDKASSGLGAFAQYLCIAEDGAVSIKPQGYSFQEAAAVPVAAITALQSIRAANIKSGEKILINGASGGVGTFTVQLAKMLGASIIGVCSEENRQLIQSLGADETINYKAQDFTANREKYDVIIDNVGNRHARELRRALKTGGRCVIVGYTSPSLLVNHLLIAPIISVINAKKVVMMDTAKSNQEDLNALRGYIESGKIRSIIDKEFAFEEMARAIEYLETGRAKGKVVLTL